MRSCTYGSVIYGIKLVYVTIRSTRAFPLQGIAKYVYSHYRHYVKTPVQAPGFVIYLCTLCEIQKPVYCPKWTGQIDNTQFSTSAFSFE